MATPHTKPLLDGRETRISDTDHSLIYYNQMENMEIGELVKRFDNFVRFSLNHKEATDVVSPQLGSKV